MLSNTFEDIRLKFEGSYYGGHYDIEIFADGRFYYSFVEGDSTDLQRGSFQVSHRVIMLFEELMDYFDFLIKFSFLIMQLRIIINNIRRWKI